ncbi:MAG: MFS transporter [Mycobacteriales bacterium]
MRDLPRVVWILAAGRLVNGAGSFVYFYLFLYLTGPRHVPLGTAGVVSGGLGAGMLVGNFTGGWFGDRFGHRRCLLVSSMVAGGATLALPWLPVAALAVVLLPLGYAAATAGVSQGALVALAVPAGDRRRSVALTRAAFNAGTVIGPPLGALLSSSSFTLLFVLDGAVTLVVRSITARLLPAEPPAPRTGGRRDATGFLRSLRADRALLVLLPAIVVVDVFYRQVFCTLPVFLRDHGHPVGLYAGLIALGSGMILCLELPVAMALRARPATAVIGTGYCLVGLGFALFATGPGTAVAIAAMAVLTCGEILYKTTATAHVLDAAPPGLVGRYQGLYTGAATSGNVLAPPVGALVYGVAPGLLWPLCAAATAGSGVVAFWSGRAGRAGGGQEMSGSDPMCSVPSGSPAA